ncbi:MAG: adenylate/guanylate cyclase domain-containing protein [Zetaproteobacteria bacterium]|nr:adenylate/guanylate cyclase domain-containing protein [Zetaproteobacteria bacterium]
MILICVCTVSLCIGMTFHHYTQFGRDADFITSIENSLLDLRYTMRGVSAPKRRVGILAIDEESIKRFGSWPFSRRFYQKAFANLKKIGVSWIGFDAIFSEPQAATIRDLIPVLKDIRKTPSGVPKTEFNQFIAQLSQMNKVSPGDTEFAQGIQNFQNIVAGYFYFSSPLEVKESGREQNPFMGLANMEASEIVATILPEGKELKDYPIGMQAYGLVPNIDAIHQSTDHFAFFSNDADYDAIVRWVTLVRIIDGRLMPSLALKTAAEALERDILVIFDTQGIESIDLVSREDESDAISIPIDPYGQGRMLANYRGPGRTFPYFSLADAYTNSFSDKQREYLKDSVLLLGMTAIGINDQRPNPFDPAYDGVEVHTTAIDNIMSQDFMKRPKSIFRTELIVLLVIGLIFAPILIFSGALVSGVSAILFLGGYIYFDRYVWFHNGTWAYIGMPLIEISTMYVLVTIYKYIVEEREKRQVQGAFAHYLSPDVIGEVLENPDSLKLGGERKVLTVFFSDVRSFTTISESLTPEQLCIFMNDYFTPMTSIILREKGVLDKYIGDAIMAFWGAPIPIPNQADVAARSSIEMLFALDKLQADFKQRGFPHCDIGIGLNTGSMSVGNMGSDERFCYTVMGDAVNLGARLEGLTKDYGIKVLMSEFTVAAFQEKDHLFRELDDIRVKGKNEPVRVYDLMRPDFLENESKIKEFIETFNAGRLAYLNKQWEQSSAYFENCLKMKPEDKSSLLYRERLATYSREGVPENWDGVFTFTHK